MKPFTTVVNDLMECTSKWNELFIFEIPRKVVNKETVNFMLCSSVPSNMRYHKRLSLELALNWNSISRLVALPVFTLI